VFPAQRAGAGAAEYKSGTRARVIMSVQAAGTAIAGDRLRCLGRSRRGREAAVLGAVRRGVDRCVATHPPRCNAYSEASECLVWI